MMAIYAHFLEKVKISISNRTKVRFVLLFVQEPVNNQVILHYEFCNSFCTEICTYKLNKYIKNNAVQKVYILHCYKKELDFSSVKVK